MASILGNVIVLAILCLAVGLAVRSIIKKRKQGGCGCGCSGCSRSSGIPEKKFCGSSFGKNCGDDLENDVK